MRKPLLVILPLLLMLWSLLPVPGRAQGPTTVPVPRETGERREINLQAEQQRMLRELRQLLQRKGLRSSEVEEFIKLIPLELTLRPGAELSEENTAEMKAYLQKRGLSLADMEEVLQRVQDLLSLQLPTPAPSPSELPTEAPSPTPVPSPRPTPPVKANLFGSSIFKLSPTTFAPVDTLAPGPDYVPGPGDEITYTLWGRVEQQGIAAVRTDGTIVIPPIGAVQITGMNLAKLESFLRGQFSRYFKGFQLAISLGKLHTIQVFVLGDVQRPGGYQVSSMATVFHALYQAGGPAETGSLRRIQLVRYDRPLMELDFYRFLLRGDRRQDLRLQNGDTIFVPPIGPIATIQGEVVRPAIYELKHNERLGDLIRMAAGLKPTAYTGRLQIDRIEDFSKRIVRDVDLHGDARRSNLHLLNGDVVTVFSVLERRENLIEVEGNVERPGKYELRLGTTVRDAILRAGGLRPGSYLLRVEVVRKESDDSTRILSINLAAAMAATPMENIVLENRDRVVVYSEKELQPDRVVTISGAVKRPGTFELTVGMRLADLLYKAGWLQDSAYLQRAEISRINPGAQGSQELNQTVFVDLTHLEKNPAGPENLVLRNHDELFIRQIPQWQLQDVMEIKGEVRFPGRYALESKKETLSHLIQRAGGLTKNAFLRGGRLFRKTQQLIKPIVDPRDKSLLTVQEEPGTTRVVVNFVAALENPHSAEDPILSNGDIITVPSTPSEVQVSGEVLTPGSITWVPGKDVYFYIERTGGLTANADTGAIHIIRANGESLKGNSRIDIGDTIVVLPRNKEERTDWGAILRDTVAITASLTTIVLLILQFGRK